MSRLYLPPSGGSPGITPAPHAEWENIASFVRVVPVLTPNGVAFSSDSITDATATADRDTLIKQFVYPLVEGTAFSTSQTVKGYMLAKQGATSNNTQSQTVIRVIASDGSTVRATLISPDTTSGTGAPTPEWFHTSYRNMQFPYVVPSSLEANYTSVAGDYLVIELGARKHRNGTADHGLRLGTNAGGDCPENLTNTTDLNSWIEFSTDLEPAPPTTTTTAAPTTTTTAAPAAVTRSHAVWIG